MPAGRRGGTELAQSQRGIDLHPVAIILEQATAQDRSITSGVAPASLGNNLWLLPPSLGHLRHRAVDAICCL